MGIFTRFRDIISSNISSMLDSAEDPEKLIRLMLREMEETLVELKAGCASTMAEATQVHQNLDRAREDVRLWDHRSELALQANREDMAREAMSERIQAQERVSGLEKELAGYDELIRKCREDIRLLEERIVSTRDKQRLLTGRHVQARVRRRAREQVRAADNLNAMRRFDDLEQRINRMENEADLAGPGQRVSTFEDLEQAAAIDAGLEALRERLRKKNDA